VSKPIDALQHAATHCNTLQHTATHCNTLQHTATLCNTQMRHIDVLNSCVKANRCTATRCKTLQHTATHCNTHIDVLNICVKTNRCTFGIFRVSSRAHTCKWTHINRYINENVKRYLNMSTEIYMHVYISSNMEIGTPVLNQSVQSRHFSRILLCSQRKARRCRRCLCRTASRAKKRVSLACWCNMGVDVCCSVCCTRK
jgi:hypothetical protein